MSRPRAVVLLSGGLDSTTALAEATAGGFECYALSVDYGQRHRRELAAARAVAAALGAREHRVASIDLRAFGGSALTADLDVPKDRAPAVMEQAIPVTYVPARNTIMLALALGWAEVLDAADLFIGVNAVDYPGYPDCRPAFIETFEALANVATKMGVEGRHISVRAPLLHLTKGQIIRRGLALGVDYGLTFSCYDPQDGDPCGRCDSCILRARGFAEAGVPDPLRIGRVCGEGPRRP